MQALFGVGGSTAEAEATPASVPSQLPPAVVRALSDKLYERRKSAALEVEAIVKNLNVCGENDAARALVTSLARDFARSPHANHRKGGLIGLAAATVGLVGGGAASSAGTNAEDKQPADVVQSHLDVCVPPVLEAFADSDARVRYYACESLYNIAKGVYVCLCVCTRARA